MKVSIKTKSTQKVIAVHTTVKWAIEKETFITKTEAFFDIKGTITSQRIKRGAKGKLKVKTHNIHSSQNYSHFILSHVNYTQLI